MRGLGVKVLGANVSEGGRHHASVHLGVFTMRMAPVAKTAFDNLVRNRSGKRKVFASVQLS